MISTQNLRKNYSRKEALTGVDLGLSPGGIIGLLGRNGVGKSTLLSILAGQVKPTAGNVTVFDRTPFNDATVMDNVCFTGVDTPYPDNWKAAAVLRAAAVRYPRWDEQRAEQLIEEFDLAAARDAKYGKLSRGQKAMVSIVIGLSSGAPLTLLDEPYVGLDTHNLNVFYRHLLAESERGERTFIMATHHIDEASRVLDRVIILGRDGTIAHEAEAAELAEQYVVATGRFPAGAETLAYKQSAGMSRAIVAKRNLPALGEATHQAADLDDILPALLEVS